MRYDIYQHTLSSAEKIKHISSVSDIDTAIKICEASHKGSSIFDYWIICNEENKPLYEKISQIDQPIIRYTPIKTQHSGCYIALNESDTKLLNKITAAYNRKDFSFKGDNEQNRKSVTAEKMLRKLFISWAQNNGFTK